MADAANVTVFICERAVAGRTPQRRGRCGWSGRLSDEPSAADPLIRPRRSLVHCWITSPALTLSHRRLSSCRVDSSATGSRSDIEATIRFAEKTLQDKLVEHHFARRRIDLPEPTCLHDGHSQPGHLEVFTPSTSDKRCKLRRIDLAAWLFHSDDAVSLARHQRLFLPAKDWMNTAVAVQDALARAVFKAAVHHSRSSINLPAEPSSSANPVSTSPPW